MSSVARPGRYRPPSLISLAGVGVLGLALAGCGTVQRPGVGTPSRGESQSANWPERLRDVLAAQEAYLTTWERGT